MGIQRIFKRAKERKDEAERVYVVTRASGKSFKVIKHDGQPMEGAKVLWRRTKEYREPVLKPKLWKLPYKGFPGRSAE